MKGRKSATRHKIADRIRNLEEKKREALHRLERAEKQKEEGDRYYLSLIRADNRFRIRPTKKLFGNVFRTVAEMAITGLETSGVSRFRFRETTNPVDIFADLLKGYDPSFWGPYNYLIPEEPIEDALIRISQLMQKRQETSE